MLKKSKVPNPVTKKKDFAKSEKTEKGDKKPKKKTILKPGSSIADLLNAKAGERLFISSGDTDKTAAVASSGSLGLDVALGNGGWAFGRIIEIFGPESSGKTSLALQGAVARQKMGHIACFIDAEHALELKFAEKVIGVDLSKDKFMLQQPDNGEQAFDAVALAIDLSLDMGIPFYIVVDSVAAMIPKKELEGKMDKEHVGLHPRLMSRGLKKLLKRLKESQSTVVFINQTREKIGVMYGNPEVTTGGKALLFYASVRVRIRNGGKVEHGGRQVGYRAELRVVKNKLAMPFRTCGFDVIFNKGIDSDSEVLDAAIEADVIKRSGGSWLSFNGKKIGNGKPKTKAALAKMPKLRAKIIEAIRKKEFGQ
jgi:recombination protein RecA